MAKTKSSTETNSLIPADPGALSVGPASVIPASQSDACQAFPVDAEPPAGSTIHSSKAGRSINRRSLMNMLVGAATFTATATPVIAAAEATSPNPIADSKLLALADEYVV